MEGASLRGIRRGGYGPAIVGLAMLALPGAARAQPSAVGAEFQVNTYTPSYQRVPAVAVGATGGFIVVWESRQDGLGTGIFARRFSASGAALATEFQVNSYTGSAELDPAVAVAPGGGFVVVWNATINSLSADLFARRFDASGTALGSEFRVNSRTASGQYEADIAMDSDGDFVVVWESYGQDLFESGVFLRRFSSSGVAQATELQVSTYTVGNQQNPAVAMDADGDFVVVWEDEPAYRVHGRRFDSAGIEDEAVFQVSLQTRQYRPAVAIEAGGDFLIAWHGYSNDGAETFARRFDSAGMPAAPELQVNTYLPGNQRDAAVAMDGDGDAMVVWRSGPAAAPDPSQDGSGVGVFALSLDPVGLPQTAELQVNSHTSGPQFRAAVASGGGRFVVVWQSYTYTQVGQTQDGDAAGIFAQRFVSPLPLDVDGNGLFDALTDGLLALRYAFGFRGATLIAGAVAGGCTRCDAPAIEDYLGGMAQ